MATGTLTTKGRDKKVRVKQVDAWRYYGNPEDDGAGRDARAVGEVRYVVGWMADQMTRMLWRVTIDGSEDWSVETESGRISPATTLGEDGEPDVAAASAKLLSLVGWAPGVVRQVVTNLFVAGELDYIATSDEKGDRWTVVSVIHPDRRDLRDKAAHRVQGLWPHPANPSKPDAPLFGVLDVLEELDWLSRLSRSQSASRIAMRGVLGAADGLSFASGGDFWAEWNAAVRASMEDPTDVSPLVLRGASELIEPAGKGLKGLGWVIPDFPYDERIDERQDKMIHRLAYGLPVPPEILLGMQAQSRATAFQVEENSYRAHIEPPARLVAAVPQEALRLILPDVGEVLVEPDPSVLLARRHSVQDVKDAYDRGLVGGSYVREVLAIPEDAAADEEDLALFDRINGGGAAAGETDPGNDAANEGGTEPVASAARSGAVQGVDDIAAQLVEIDYAARLELAGATVLAVDRARERIGAQARTREGLRDAVGRDVPNNRVAALLGADTLTSSGVSVDQSIVSATQPLADWWATRVREVYAQVASLLSEDVQVRWSETDVSMSVDLLVDLVASHIIDTLDSETVRGLPADQVRRVMAVAGGEVDVAAAAITATAAGDGDLILGVATGVHVLDALQSVGVVQTEWRWLWRPGDHGGVFDPHRALNGRHAPVVADFGYTPGGYPNGGHCRCDLLPIFRDELGHFAPDPDSDEPGS